MQEIALVTSWNDGSVVMSPCCSYRASQSQFLQTLRTLQLSVAPILENPMGIAEDPLSTLLRGFRALTLPFGPSLHPFPPSISVYSSVTQG